MERKCATKQNSETPGLKSREPDSAIQKEREWFYLNFIYVYCQRAYKYDSHVLQAARNPIELDEMQANAVAARIELDLRIGAAFTRLQTLQLKSLGGVLAEKLISYGKNRLSLCGIRRIYSALSEC